MSRVSVVIPLFNDSNFIRRAVESVLRQMHLKEIVIVDDCSTDDSVAIAEALAVEFAEVSVISLPENSGPAMARNVGATHVSGDFICFLDSDDEFIEGYFADVVPILDSNPEMHALKVGMEYIDPIRGYILPNFDPRYRAVVFSSACNVMIRLQSFLKMHGFPIDPAFRQAHGGEDAAFCSALAEFLPPLGDIDRVYYRCWSNADSHVHRFLATTRLAEQNPDGFEFVVVSEDQKPGGNLSEALFRYVDSVRLNLLA